VEAILEAAVDLFSSRGYARTSTNHIARRAGVSVGSLYQYFPNKDAVLTALLARHLEAVDSAISACIPQLRDPSIPLRDGIRRLLEQLREVHEADPRLSRAIEQQAGQMPVVPEGLAGYKRSHVATVAEVLAHRPDVRPGNYALMAVFLSAVTETVSGILVHGMPGRFGRDEMLDEAVEALCRYVERPASRTS
jgi:AcrR family transcriptional regulator